MPTYDYKCAKCNHVFEHKHSMLHVPDVRCPKCKGKAAKQISTGLHISIRGSRFCSGGRKEPPPPERKDQPPCRHTTTSVPAVTDYMNARFVSRTERR